MRSASAREAAWRDRRSARRARAARAARTACRRRSGPLVPSVASRRLGESAHRRFGAELEELGVLEPRRGSSRCGTTIETAAPRTAACRRRSARPGRSFRSPSSSAGTAARSRARAAPRRRTALRDATAARCAAARRSRASLPERRARRRSPRASARRASLCCRPESSTGYLPAGGAQCA